jgi:hypothetical protein
MIRRFASKLRDLGEDLLALVFATDFAGSDKPKDRRNGL